MVDDGLGDNRAVFELAASATIAGCIGNVGAKDAAEPEIASWNVGGG